MLTLLLQLPTSISLPTQDPLFFSGILLTVFKILFILSAFLYVFFAGIVIRQIHLMKETVHTPFSPYVLLLGYAHFALAIWVVIFFIGVL